MFQTLRNSRTKYEIATALDHLARGDARIPLDPLIVAYARDVRWLVRQAALRALGNCADQSASDVLIEVGAHTSDPMDLVYVNAALGELEAKGCVPFLERNTRHPKEDVASSAIAALAKVGSLSDLPCFLSALSDKRWVVKWYAMAAIEKHGDAAAIRPVLERVKRVLLRQQKTTQKPRSELAMGLAFLSRFRKSHIEVTLFFEDYLPHRMSRLSAEEIAAISETEG